MKTVFFSFFVCFLQGQSGHSIYPVYIFFYLFHCVYGSRYGLSLAHLFGVWGFIKALFNGGLEAGYRLARRF